MKNVLIVLFMMLTCCMKAQDLEKMAREINDEGIELYRSEMASWYGTDVFMANYKAKENIGGYFSYIDNQVPKCIFFSKANKVLGTISFPANYNPKDAKVDLTERDFTPGEKDYFTIRQHTLERIKADTIFKHYKNTSLNIVPIIRNNMKKVYVLTGPSINNIIVFGNDYLLTFDNKNEIKKVEKLHNGIIIQNIHDEKTGKTISGIHSHVIENWQAITPTDICTLMLYYKFTGWADYITLSKKLASIWKADHQLVVMKSEDFRNMAEHILEKEEEPESEESVK